MANKIYEYYQGLPGWAKGVVVIGGGLVAFYVGRRLYFGLFPTESQRKNKELVNNISSEIAKAQKAGQKQSFADSNYNTFANTIYNGMRYAVGDDYGTVEKTMKQMKNDLDVAKLIAAFGMRQNYLFGIPAGSPMDLFTFVQAELGNDYLGLTNYRVKSINEDWKKKGITYQI